MVSLSIIIPHYQSKTILCTFPSAHYWRDFPVWLVGMGTTSIPVRAKGSVTLKFCWVILPLFLWNFAHVCALILRLNYFILFEYSEKINLKGEYCCTHQDGSPSPPGNFF